MHAICSFCLSVVSILFNANPTDTCPPYLLASFSFINHSNPSIIHYNVPQNKDHEGISSNRSKSPLATQHHHHHHQEEEEIITSCSCCSSSRNSREEEEEGWKVVKEEEGMMRKVRNSVVRVGKKIVITGVVISSTPIFVPPLLVGFVFAVPFGFVFATYACTDKLMCKLLSETDPSRPCLDLLPQGEEEQAWKDKEEEELVDDIKKTLETRIEFVGDDQRGLEENLGSERNGVMEYVDYGRLEEEEKGVDDGTGKWEERMREGGGGGYAGEVDDGTWEQAWEEVGRGGNVEGENYLMSERYGVMEESRDDETYFDKGKIEEDRSVDDDDTGIWKEEIIRAAMEEDPNVQDDENVEEERMIGGEAFVTGEEDDKLCRNTAGKRKDENNEQNFINMVVEEGVLSGEQGASEIVEVKGIPVEEIFISRKEDQKLVKDSENVIQEARELLENIEQQDEQVERDEAILEEKDKRNFDMEDEVEIPIQKLLEPIERDDEPLAQRKGVMQEGIPAEKILELKVARDFGNAEEEVEMPIEKTLEPIERDDEPVVDRKGVMQEDKEAWNVSSTAEEEIPAEKTMSSIEQDNELVPKTEEVKHDDSGELDMGLNMEEEEMPIEDISVSIEEENLGEVPVEGTYFSIEEEKLGETMGVGQGARHEADAGKMIDVEELPAFDQTEDIRDEESRVGKIPVQEQISEDGTEQRGIERSDRDIAYDGKERKLLEMEVGIVKESGIENICGRVLNDQVERTVEAKKGDETAKKDEGEEIADGNSQAMMNTGAVAEKKIKSVPDSTLEVIKKPTRDVEQVTTLEKKNAREVADESGLYLFDEETANDYLQEIEAIMTKEIIMEKKIQVTVADSTLEMKKRPKTEEERVRTAPEKKNAREIADESGLYLFNEETSVSVRCNFEVNKTHGNEASPAIALNFSSPSAVLPDHQVDSRPPVSSEHSNKAEEQHLCNLGIGITDSLVQPVPSGMQTTIPAKQVLNKEEEEKIWQEIDSIKKIVGYKAAPKATCMEEIKDLYLFTGVEPPLESEDSSDLPAIHDKLRLLMAIIGVK